jgi:hypothetical protein
MAWLDNEVANDISDSRSGLNAISELNLLSVPLHFMGVGI